METSYRDWEKRRREQGGGARTARHKTKGQKAVLGPRERRRLAQLIICVALFLVVFLGRGIMPEKMEGFRQELLEMLQADTDFQAVFAGLGHSISEGKPVTQTLGTLWTDVFGGGTVTASSPAALTENRLYQAESVFLNGYEGGQTPAQHWLQWTPEQSNSALEPEPVPTPVPTPTPTPAPEPEVPAVEHVEYTGPALPDNVTMDKYNLSVLGVTETVTPVMGQLTSAFGWREHPVDGGEKFHNGVDLAVNTGTDVLAFAAGTVDYIGESPIYGNYLQLKHAGGLTSFYAHCSELCVQQGQNVTAGQKIAESGATGNVTGPHLHFEMKLNGVRIDPIYYIETS